MGKLGMEQKSHWNLVKKKKNSLWREMIFLLNFFERFEKNDDLSFFLAKRRLVGKSWRRRFPEKKLKKNCEETEKEKKCLASATGLLLLLCFLMLLTLLLLLLFTFRRRTWGVAVCRRTWRCRWWWRWNREPKDISFALVSWNLNTSY